MPTTQALDVIEHLTIQVVTNTATGNTTRCATDQTTQQGASQGAQGYTGRTRDKANGCDCTGTC
jgi:hypothetical protein